MKLLPLAMILLVASCTHVPAAEHFVYVGGSEPNVITYKLNLANGDLENLGKTPAGDHPGYLAFHPSGRSLYVANESGHVRAFAIQPKTGKLTQQSQQPSGGTLPVHVFVHPLGRWLFVSNYKSGNVRVFPLNGQGDMGPPTDTKLSGDESHQIVGAPSGDAVFVPCRGPNHVAQFTFNAREGRLTANDPATVASDDPRHMAFHPDGKFAYLVNETPANVVSFVYDAASHRLSSSQKLPLGNNEASGSHIVVTPNGKFVYAGGRSTNRIYGFAVNPQTGRLVAKGNSNGGGAIDTPRNFAVDPTGQFLVVANQGSHSVVVLRIGDDGSLTPAAPPVPAVQRAQAVVVVPVWR